MGCSIESLEPGVPAVRQGCGPIQRCWNPGKDMNSANREIYLMGASLGTGNRGVSALGASLVKLAREYCPDAEVRMLLGRRTNTPFQLRSNGQQLQVGVVNYRLSPGAKPREHFALWLLLAFLYRVFPLESWRDLLRRRHPLIRASAQAAFVGDIRGGDSFSDIYGLKNFVLGSLEVLAVVLVRREVVLLPQTYGPYKSWISRKIARFILRRSSTILSRDRQSIATAEGLAGRPGSCRFCPDVAFSLESRLPEKLCIDPPLPSSVLSPPAPAVLIGLNVNGLMYRGGYTRDNMFGLRLDYREYLSSVSRALLADPRRHLLFVPHTFAPPESVESDPAACQEVRAALPAKLRSRAHLLEGEYDQSEIKWIIGQCGFFIGSRMHSCIAALSQGIPTVGVAYSKKFAGVFDSVGAADWVVDGRQFDSAQAVAKTMKILQGREALCGPLAGRVRAAQAELQTTFEQMLATAVAPNGKLRTTAMALTA